MWTIYTKYNNKRSLSASPTWRQPSVLFLEKASSESASLMPQCKGYSGIHLHSFRMSQIYELSVVGGADDSSPYARVGILSGELLPFLYNVKGCSLRLPTFISVIPFYDRLGSESGSRPNVNYVSNNGPWLYWQHCVLLGEETSLELTIEKFAEYAANVNLVINARKAKVIITYCGPEHSLRIKK